MRSPNFNSRDGTPIDMLVLHYTGMQTGEAALQRLCDQDAKVSAHYLIDEDGTVHSLVDEEMRAWHAGVAFWRGSTDINSRSIGIELVNPGHEWGYSAFPEEQITSLIALCQEILARHAIPARNVVGHSDVAPSRKEDPGELFPWKRVAGEGIGIFPDTTGVAPVSEHAIEEALELIGYDGREVTNALIAFQRHFCPHRLDGEADYETRSMLAAVRNKV